MGLSPHLLVFGHVGLSLQLGFWWNWLGVYNFILGVVGLIPHLFGGWIISNFVWVVVVLLSFLRVFYFGFFRWKFIDICSTFTHSHSFIYTIICCVLWGSASVGRCAFFSFGNQTTAK